jgi:GntR family transcriptional regulator, transcriptional repressor for pyruvate dehydrogenase complex
MASPEPERLDRGSALPPRRGPNPRAGNSKPHKTATLLALRIVGEITDQELAPGTRLPAERDMLREYGVARGSLREALRFLEMEGVLTIKPGPGGGPTVSAPDHETLASTFALLLQFAGARFGTILEVRQLVEPAIAAIAAERATPEQLDEIRELLEEMERHLDDEGGFLERNERFHDLIAWASGNPLFGYLISSLGWITDGAVLGVGYSREQLAAVQRAHQRVFDALASGDAERARGAMERHLREFANHLERRYPHVVDQPLRWEHFR